MSSFADGREVEVEDAELVEEEEESEAFDVVEGISISTSR